jgi:hypothetical protein
MMRTGKRLKALLFVLALAFPGCEGGEIVLDPNPLESTPPAIGFSPLSVEPAQLEFTHIIGRDPCPQVVGTVTIRNTGRLDEVATVAVRPPLLILGREQFVTEGSVPVEGGRTIVFEVFFDCSVQSDFTRLVDVSSSRELAARVQVIGRVRR